ncbi:MAG: hypothetical protein MK187_08640 [Acidimicrobiales bacterium]|nr:hypothetical protein [Acidimicrobiales bacterium]
MKVNGFLAIISALVVALAFVLLLTPVSSQFSDPCGSVLVPTKVHYSDGGELVFANTPPCHDARMARLPIGVVVGVAGLAILVVSLVTGRRRD